jgi:hypothetical protein
MVDAAIRQWFYQSLYGRRGRGFQFRDNVTASVLMLKKVFKLPLLALEGFINSLFQLLNVPLKSLGHSCISKRVKTELVRYQLSSQ